jgi:hypothetical protein
MNWPHLAQQLPCKTRYWRKYRGKDGGDEEEDVSSYNMALRKRQNTGVRKGKSGSHSVENSLWKRIRTSRKTDNEMNEIIPFVHQRPLNVYKSA